MHNTFCDLKKNKKREKKSGSLGFQKWLFFLKDQIRVPPINTFLCCKVSIMLVSSPHKSKQEHKRLLTVRKSDPEFHLKKKKGMVALP